MNPTLRTRLTVAIGFVCALSYFASLTQPALRYAALLHGREQNGIATESYWGISLLLLGWLEAIGGTSTGIAWFANPFFGLGLLALLFQRPGWAAMGLGVALAFASASFGIETVCINEAGTEAPVVGFGPGFWLWYLAIGTGFVASLAVSLIPQRRPETAVLLTDADFIRPSAETPAGS